ncbi:hypothetical protein [Dyella psychrodurans]|uniref:Uncharacterized protein n=1 Tax=Dyella psychrodurans TaxID=1927960 RepID=A0A370X0A7_9GAMM|nr:hypothetical protein [Dyella psychrodurans]RDS81786.1 hypothetical protein DWU99_15260 [Dyella psychrodurans]
MPDIDHSSVGARLKRVLAKADTYVVKVLYYSMGAFLYLNVISLLSGRWIALLSIAVQALVLISVYFRKTWAYIVVGTWAVVGVISGVTFWLAVLLRGGEIVQPVDRILISNITLILGVYFLRNAKSIRYRNQVSAFDRGEARDVDAQ